MINCFCETCPQAKQKDIQDLCRSFKSQANGVYIFPKLSSMTKCLVKGWAVDKEMTFLEQQIKEYIEVVYEQF